MIIKNFTRAALILLLHAACSHAQPNTLAAINLTTDSRPNPIGIATSTPAFAWTLTASSPAARNQRQTAYRIRLATSAAQLAKPSAVSWDSGRVASAVYWQRPYAGPPLQSHTTYVWQVQV